MTTQPKPLYTPGHVDVAWGTSDLMAETNTGNRNQADWGPKTQIFKSTNANKYICIQIDIKLKTNSLNKSHRKVRKGLSEQVSLKIFIKDGDTSDLKHCKVNCKPCKASKTPKA